MKKLLVWNGTTSRRVSLGEFGAMDTDKWIVVEIGTRKKEQVNKWSDYVYGIWLIDFGEKAPVIFGVRSALKAHAKIIRAIMDAKGTDMLPRITFGGFTVGIVGAQICIQKYRQKYRKENSNEN